MFGTQHYWLFVLSAMLLNITPGQDSLYIIGRSMAQGRSAGLWSVCGISSGAVIHTLAAALGLTAILAASASAFALIRYLGAAYLVYLGIRMWHSQLTNCESSARSRFKQCSPWSLYRAGLFTNLLNPKVAFFNLAFLPQFVDPLAHSKFAAILFLGATCLTTGTIWCLFLALAAARVSSRLRSTPSVAPMIRRATGALFVGLGIRLAVGK